MNATDTLHAPEARPMRSAILWGMLALLLGCAAALSGLPGIYAVIVLATVIVFAGVAMKCPTLTMSAAICCLGLVPFSWGILTGVLPKLFGDEALLLLYLVAFPGLYLFTSRSWHGGFRSLYFAIALFVFTQALSLLAGTDLVAFRNLLETYVLGALLLILYLQEVANSTRNEVLGESVVWLTVLIAALSVVERVLQRNPVMEQGTGILYLSPELVRITEGVYRPYVSFFHPSETGTFMALGVPFAIRRWIERRSWISVLLLAIIAGGLFVNATRGVWIGVAVATLLFARNPLLILLSIVPVAGIGATIGYLVFRSTPFMQRLTDPNNLYSRFVYWSLGLEIFASHPILGVGHMQFKEVYLGYVHDLSNTAHFDIAKVFAVDNMYLTTLVEHGLVGLVSLVGLLIFLGVSLRNLRKRLLASHLPVQASFVRCSQLALVTYAATGCFADVNQFTKATKYVFILVGLGFGVGARYLDSSHSSDLRAPMTQHNADSPKRLEAV